MDTVLQQITALIERSEKILLCTHRKPDGDAIGSIMGLYKALNLLGKEVTASCADNLPESFNFLPEMDRLNQEVPGGQDFVVTLDCDQTEVDKLKYHLEDNKIHIIITPKQGKFKKENVSCQERADHYDLIITVDVADISQLGKLYTDNVDLFTSTPMVNIDHHISNPGFGKVNLIDVSSSSTAEILFGLIRHMEAHFQKKLLVPETATFLLSGVTTDTGSFQNANTTPKSMEVAAELMEAGANQHDIIKYLFRTKKMTTLKLWGKILSRVEVDEKHRVVWSVITQQDVKQTGSTMDASGEIIDELLVHAPEADIVALFKEDADFIGVSFRSTTAQANVMQIAQQFGGGGHVQAAGAKVFGKTLQEVMNLALSAIQKYQRERLGLVTEEKSEQPKITQVLEGYTTAPTAPVKPTLQERAVQAPASPVQPELAKPAPAPVQPAPVQPIAVQPIQPPPQAVPPSPPKDIHSQARAAIEAEQGHAENRMGQSAPSAALREPQTTRPPERPMTPPSPPSPPTPPAPPAPPKPIVPPVSFVPPASVTPPPAPKPVPPAQPAAPKPAMPNPFDDGVKVSYNNNSPVKPPEIPSGSSEPVVKTNPTPNAPNPFSSLSPNDFGGFGGQTGPAVAGSSGQNPPTPPVPPAPPAPPAPPKDPFALGDDGLTDIERALGGL